MASGPYTIYEWPVIHLCPPDTSKHLRMDVLDIFGCSGNIGEVAACAVLRAFGPPGRTAGVHKKKRGFAGIFTGSILAP